MSSTVDASAPPIKRYPATLMALFSYAGVQENTHECVIQEIFWAARNGIPLHYSRISGDALIERSRSRVIGQFLKSGQDVIVMIDHDIAWRPGDVCELARIAYEKNALVGGLYCKRAFGKGWATRIKGSCVQANFGAADDAVIEADGLATGFMAIPRKVIEDMLAKLDIDGEPMKQEMHAAMLNKDTKRINWLQDMSIGFVRDGAYREADHEYHDYFRCIRRQVGDLKQYEFLSEDWSFSIRAEHCGHKTYIATRPILMHHGEYGFSIQDGMDANDKARAAEIEAQNNNGQNQDAKAA